MFYGQGRKNALRGHQGVMELISIFTANLFQS
ncbi:MAG: hypothetical protein QG613_592 [Pseudomonadota bacterium]|nr:hypothetical protein [Pseudomonadota bacterium]